MNITEVPEITTKHGVMACPVCNATIWALVTVRPILRDPVVNPDQTVSIQADATMTNFDVRHNCADDPTREQA